MSENLVNSRQEVISRMVEAAQAKGGGAVLAIQFDTSEMGGNGTESCAYAQRRQGSQARIRRLPPR